MFPYRGGFGSHMVEVGKGRAVRLGQIFKILSPKGKMTEWLDMAATSVWAFGEKVWLWGIG